MHILATDQPNWFYVPCTRRHRSGYFKG